MELPLNLVVLVSLQIILSIITIIGNAIVILVILKDPCQNLKKVATVFIVNLAIADLLLGLVIEPIFCVLLLSSVSQEIFEYIRSVLDFAVEASCLTLVALAVQRWIVVEMPLKAKNLQTPRRLTIIIAVIWLMAGFLASLPWLKIKIQEIDYDYLMFNIVGSLLCITLMCVYGRIWVLVRRSTRLRMKLTNCTNEAEKQPLVAENQVIREERIREAKLTQTFFIVCGAFIICWMPALLYVNINGKDNTISFGFCLLAGLLNSALNPIIYSLRNDKFKQAIRKMLSRSPQSTKIAENDPLRMRPFRKF